MSEATALKAGRDQTLARVLAAGRSDDGRHSTLFRWLHENHDTLVAEFAKRPPRWVALVLEFAEAGLTDRRGKAPTCHGARQTWLRVRRAVAQERRTAPPARRAKAPPPGLPSSVRILEQPGKTVTERPMAASTSFMKTLNRSSGR